MSVSASLCAKIVLLFEKERVDFKLMEYVIKEILPNYIKQYSKIDIDSEQRAKLKALANEGE